MKKTLLLALLAVAAAVPALACDGNEGFSCCNQCPLAQEANTHRSTGRESMATSTAVRTAMAAQVEKNLARV